MQRKIFALACFFFICANCRAQSSSFVPAGLSFENFTTEDGLSDNYINHIYQDSRGFIWISTPDGLNRFDGTAFKKFYAGKQRSNSLPSNIINSVIEYKKNFLLVATHNGIVVMNTIDQQFFIPADSTLSSAFVYYFFPDQNGTIWLALNKGLVLIDTSLIIRKVIPWDQKKVSGAYCVHRLKNGKLIILAINGYYYVDEKKNAFIPLSDQVKDAGVIKEPLFSYYDDASNSLFTSNWHTGLYRINLDDGSVKNFGQQYDCNHCLPSNIIYAVKRNMSGQLWVASLAGLALFNEKENRFITYSHHPGEDPSLVYNEIMCLFEDHERNLWVGTRAGLSKLSNSALSIDYYKKEFEIDRNADVSDIIKGSDGNIYATTYGNGLFSINSTTREIKNFGRDLIPFAWSVNKDGNNIIVTGHGKKMYRLELSSGKTKPLTFLKPYQDSGDLVLFAYTDSRGGRWYSINLQQGLLHCKPGASTFTQYSNTQSPAPFPHSYFNTVAEDKKGRLWFAVNKRNELVSYDYYSNRFTVHALANEIGASIEGLTCLLADDNALWIGTFGTGLIRFEPDTKSMQLFTIEDGLSANHISSLAKDNKNRLWVGTRKGLSCLVQGQKRFISFTQSDGLPQIDFNDGAIYYDSAENRLYAGAKQTLINLNPDEFLKSTTSAGPLFIDEVLVNNKKINFSNLTSLKLPYYQNNLQFSFISIDFGSPGSTKYYYKLQGADKDWIESGRLRSASYANLPAGTYNFLVKTTKNGNQYEAATSLSFNIKIEPPWWQTWWFRFSAAIVMFVSIFYLIRFYYRRKLEKQTATLEKQQAIEKERTRIATDMHDDLGSGLSRIKFLSETIRLKTGNDEAIKKDVEKISFYSDEMVEKMGEIVWALNEKNDTIADLVAFTRSYAMEYLSSQNILCELNAPLNLPDTFITGEMRRNIFLSVKECLHNIVKHSGASEVYFSISLQDNIEIIIHDNGKGIDWNNIRAFSNGLQNIQKRIKDIHGNAAFFNELGTKVTLSVPFKV